ncbi:MAG: NUDIX hydrolase [Rhodobacteraceae bacterium]|jgi:8-oxo-dGTP diphosphatase|nr:NUDIX hydrolase [Paracoccaceae bacterium]
MIRRYGEPVKKGQHYKHRPGVYAILLIGPNILLTHQDYPKPEFQLPGGGVNTNEHPIVALHREVFEETGWKIDITRRINTFRRFTFMPEYDIWAEKLCTIYLARPVFRLGPPKEISHTAVWLPAAKAVQLLGNAGDRAMLAKVLGISAARQ